MLPSGLNGEFWRAPGDWVSVSGSLVQAVGVCGGRLELVDFWTECRRRCLLWIAQVVVRLKASAWGSEKVEFQ